MRIWILLICAAVRSTDEYDSREHLTSRQKSQPQTSNKCALVGKVFVAYLVCQGVYCAYKWYNVTPEDPNTSQPQNQDLQTLGCIEKAFLTSAACYAGTAGINIGDCLVGSGSFLSKAFQFSKNRLSKLFHSSCSIPDLTSGTQWKDAECQSGSTVADGKTCTTICRPGFTGTETNYKCDENGDLQPKNQISWCVSEDERKKFPFRVEMVTSMSGEEKRFSSGCGGALIAPSWILSAGHCQLNQITPDKNIQLLDGTMYAVLGGKRAGRDPSAPEGKQSDEQNKNEIENGKIVDIAKCIPTQEKDAKCPVWRKITERYTINWKQMSKFGKTLTEQGLDALFYHDLALYKLETPLSNDEFKPEDYLAINVVDVLQSQSSCELDYAVFRWDKNVKLHHQERPWQPISNSLKAIKVSVFPYSTCKYEQETSYTPVDKMWLRRTKKVCENAVVKKVLDENNKCTEKDLTVDGELICSRFDDKLNCFDLCTSLDNEYCARDSGSPGMLKFTFNGKTQYAHFSTVSTGWGCCGQYEVEQVTYTAPYWNLILKVMEADAENVKLAIMKSCNEGEICVYNDQNCKVKLERILKATNGKQRKHKDLRRF